jgi:FkbM family methyltransferase
MREDMGNYYQRIRGTAFFFLYRLKRALRWMGLEKVPGVTRAYRFLKRRFLPDGTVLVKNGENLLYVDLADEVVTPAVVAKARREYEMDVYASLLQPGMTVIDVGANIGHYAIVAARRVGRVYAFEPEPRNFQLLARNVAVNGLSNVVAEMKAVADRRESRCLYVSEYNLGSHSLAPENAPDSRRRIEVETVTIDEYHEQEMDGCRVDLLKVDTQGAETMIVNGACKLLSGESIIVVMECWPFGLKRMGSSAAELVDQLGYLGFDLTIIDERNRSMTSLDPTSLKRMSSLEEEYGSHFALLGQKRS